MPDRKSPLEKRGVCFKHLATQEWFPRRDRSTACSIVFYQQHNSRDLMPHNRYKQPDLPYANNHHVPTISKDIMRLHHDKHYLAYINGANHALDKLKKTRE